MNTEAIKEKVKEIISVVLEIELDKIHSSSSFAQDLGIDSLDIVELVMTLEGELNIEIPDEDIETFITVDDTVKYIKKRVGRSVF